jgi:hypothetical protein
LFFVFFSVSLGAEDILLGAGGEILEDLNELFFFNFTVLAVSFVDFL